MSDKVVSNEFTRPPIARRDFLKTTTAAAAGLTIVPRHVLGAGMTAPSDKLKASAVTATQIDVFRAFIAPSLVADIRDLCAVGAPGSRAGSMQPQVPTRPTGPAWLYAIGRRH